VSFRGGERKEKETFVCKRRGRRMEETECEQLGKKRGF